LLWLLAGTLFGGVGVVIRMVTSTRPERGRPNQKAMAGLRLEDWAAAEERGDQMRGEEAGRGTKEGGNARREGRRRRHSRQAPGGRTHGCF